MEKDAIIADFEKRTGHALPNALRAALVGSRKAYVTHELFADPIAFGPLDDAPLDGATLEDFGYVFGPVDNYDGYFEPNCLKMDPFNLGDEIFLVGRDAHYDPALMFVDHETCEVITLVPSLEEALRYAA